MKAVRNEGWPTDRTMTSVFGITLAGCPYDEELSGPDGMHFHIWVPKGTTKEQLQDKVNEIRSDRDATGVSWDYEKPGMRKAPDDSETACMQSLIEAVEEKSMAKLKWGDGEYCTVDLFTASAIVKIYRNVNESNKEKLERLLLTGPDGLAKVSDLSFQLLK